MTASGLLVGRDAPAKGPVRASAADAWDDRRGQLFVTFIILAGLFALRAISS